MADKSQNMVMCCTNKTTGGKWLQGKWLQGKRSHIAATVSDMLVYILNEGQHMAQVVQFL